MNETMGQIIRRLRKDKNLTQEELAMQLNVTNQAVSKWENGDCMPDISQVVPLSNVFGVSTDVLFGKNDTDGDEEIIKFIREAERKISNKPADDISRFAHRKECCEEVQAMLATYPNHFALLCCSLNFIVFLLWDYTEEQFTDEITDKESEMKVWESEGIRQGNIVLNHCTDSYLLNIANRCLVSIYRIMNDYAKAEEHAKKLTDDREKYLAIVYDDMGRTEDAMKQYSIGVHDCFHKLTQILPLLGYLYRKQKKFDEAYTCYRLFPDIYDLMFKNSEDEVPYYTNHPCYDWCAATCMDLGQYDEAMNWLEKWLRHEQIIAMNHNVVTESKLPYFNGLIFKDTYHESYPRENRITPSLEWDSFDPIRDTARFKSILADAEAFERGE